VGNIFKTRFSEAKRNLEGKIKKMTGSGLGLKMKPKPKKSQSQGKRRKVKGIYIEKKMECLKSGLEIFLKRSIQTSIVNSHTVTYKPFAPADNPTQLEFNCSGHTDYYIDLNSVRLLLRIKLVKIDLSDIENAEPNTVGCVNIQSLVLSVSH